MTTEFTPEDASASALPDWRCRHGSARMHADTIAQLARVVGEELLQLSACEGDLADVHAAMRALRAALDEAEQLSQHFACHDLHAAGPD
jgi:hypothetical protein